MCVLPGSSATNSSASLYPQLYPPQADNCFLLLKTVKEISLYSFFFFTMFSSIYLLRYITKLNTSIVSFCWIKYWDKKYFSPISILFCKFSTKYCIHFWIISTTTYKLKSAEIWDKDILCFLFKHLGSLSMDSKREKRNTSKYKVSMMYTWLFHQQWTA